MAYEVVPLEITTRPEKVIETNTAAKQKKIAATSYTWWLAETDGDLIAQVLSTTEFLKRTNANRIRQASVFTRLFSGKPLYNFSSSNAALDTSAQLPIGRPTANVVYSCIDTLVSMISQDRPKTIFLTNNGHYKDRKLAKQANMFITGELYRTKAYDLGALALRDACVLGDGFLKVFAKDNKVCVERTLETELLADFNDAYYSNPRQLIQLKLVDRGVMAALNPKKVDIIAGALQGNVDSTPRSTETISDQIILSEAWHLPSSEDAKDGRHVIVCSEGVILDEEWTKPTFPFVKFSYNPNIVGFFSQGLAEIIMPTQMEIYRTLIVASQSLELMGVPRIYIDELSKIVETSFNNRIGTIIKGRGNPPTILNATSNTPEFYQWIQWLIANAYQMSGVSSMAAQAKKEPGLNSGEAIREANDLQSARFAALERRYDNTYVDLSYMMIECAREIAEETGSYMTVYPGKNGTQEVDFKHIGKLKDAFVIQCEEESGLSNDPAARQQQLSEKLAAGEITLQEFRRLSAFPDLQQSDQLATALEERILWSLDEIVENGDKNYLEIAPDPYILDPTDLATTLCVNYINLYKTLQLEEDKIQVLRDWGIQVGNLKAQAAQALSPPPQAQPPGSPQGQLPPTAPPAVPVGPTSNAQV
jgi:hypothetical protein